MIGLEREMVYRVRTTQSLEPTVGSPLGAKQYWQVSEATLDGPRIRATLAATGLDWMAVSVDGYWRPDVRAQFVTDDGAVILLHYTGVVEQTETFKAAAAADRETSFDAQYMRLFIGFETGAERYRWLNTNLFVAQGRLLGVGHIEYEVFRVT
jgi:hypothetical protein